jgi:hypothetical protein
MGKRVKRYTIAFAAAAWASATALADDATIKEAPEPASLAAPASGAGIPVSPVQVPEPAPALIAGTDKADSALGGTAPPAGTLAELSSTRPAPSHAVRVAAVPQAGRQEQRLSTAGPGPADPWALLCALVVVAYIALRKLRALPGAGWSERITPGNHL